MSPSDAVTDLNAENVNILAEARRVAKTCGGSSTKSSIELRRYIVSIGKNGNSIDQNASHRANLFAHSAGQRGFVRGGQVLNDFTAVWK